LIEFFSRDNIYLKGKSFLKRYIYEITRIAADAGGFEYIRCAKDGVFKRIAGCSALE